MKEYQLRQGLGKTIAFSLCVWASVAGLFSCDSDRFNGGRSIGKLSLNLAADTANIKGGTLSTKAGNVLEAFEDVDNYTVQIFQGSDTLKSVLYKDFPSEMEISEGAYTLLASKGENLPAAFDNPYFEQCMDFVIKKDMKTPLEMTCTMANARVYAEYSEDFLKAYSDYSVSLKTSSLDDVFSITKGETRGAYLQVAEEGTPLSIAISLLRDSWEEPQVYTVTDPTITLKPKDSVRLKFATDGKTGDGLALSIELDDSMEEADLEFGIPDFMWKPFTDLRIWACGFENNVPVEMNVTNGYPGDSCTIRAEVPGRIKECWMVRLEDGEKIDSVDIATTEGLKTAEEVWGVNAVSSPIAGVKGLELDLKGAFNKMYASDRDKTYGFSVYVNDALNVMHTSDVITASVNLKAAKEPAVGIFELAVPSKHPLEKDTAIAVMAEAGINALTLKVSKDDVVQKQYNLLADNLPEDIYYDKQKHKVVFKKECSSLLESKKTDESIYSYELSVTDNLNKTVTKTSTLTVTPVFTIVVPEGDVWTNRATIQVVENVNYSKSYQLKVGDQWQDYSDATITGLKPNTTYTVRALVNGWATTEATFATEAAFQIPDGGFDQEWTKDVIKAKNTDIVGLGLIGKDIDIWYPYQNKETAFWSTNNSITTSADREGGTAYYIQYSGTQKKDNAIELTTLGYGAGSTFTYFPKYVIFGDPVIGGKPTSVSPAALYAVSLENGDLVEGHRISSRPAKLSFKYKYQPYNSDKFVVSLILENSSRGKIVEKNVLIGETQKNWTYYILDFSEYMDDPGQNTIKADRIKIRFESGTNKSYYGIHGNVPNLEGNADSKWIGSVLTIDDVELIYE